MRYLPRALLAGGTGFAVSLLAACGGGPGLLSGNQAAQLKGQLDQVSAAVAAHDCGAAATNGQHLSNSVAGLPVTINPTLRRDLGNGVSVVYTNAIRDCHRTTSTTSSTTSSTTTSSTTTTSTTTTSTTSTPPVTPTTPPVTPTTNPVTPTTTPPTTTSPSGGGGLGGGGGGGGGAQNG